jgi:glycoside/pentoside/hexuronide:cation symporter, GPH family
MKNSSLPAPDMKLPVLEKIGFGAGDAAVNVVWSSMALILTFFYTDVYGLRVEHIGMLIFIPRLLDAFADVAMGMLTDARTTPRGRYRPYLLYGAVPFGLAVMIVFTTPDFAYAGKLAWAYLTYTLLMFVFTSVTIPYISLPGVITDDPQERLSANGYRLFFAKIAALAVTTFVPLFAARWSDAEKAKGYQAAMILMAGAATVLFLFCYATTKERVQHVIERKPLRLQLALLLRNDQWLVLAAVCIVGTIGYVIRGSVALFYAKYFLGGDARVQSLFITTGVAGNILAMVASTWITKKFCKIQLFRWTQILVFVLSLALYFGVQPGQVAPALVLFFLIQFVVDLHAPVFWSAISEAVDYGEIHSGQRVAGLAFGGISWCQKMGMSLAGLVVGGLLTHYGYVADAVQSAFTLNGIALLLTVIPGCFHLAMGLLMFRYRITDAYYAAMKRDGQPAV